MAIETLPFIGAVRRMIRAAGKRTGDCDEAELAELMTLRDAVEDAIQAAVDGQRETGRSWDAIASATGSSRQAAYQRYEVRRRVLPVR